MKIIFGGDNEQLKHNLATQFEDKKWAIKRQELEFVEAGLHLRSLNGFLWQVPGMAIAITGGIWYGVANIQADVPKTWVLSFVGIFNILTIFVLWRLRYLIGQHLSVQENFLAKPEVKQNQWHPNYIVVGCWSTMLAFSALLSFAGAIHPASINESPAVTHRSIEMELQLKTLLKEQTLIHAQMQMLIQEQLPFLACVDGKLLIYDKSRNATESK
jgi:hypothetical protein